MRLEGFDVGERAEVVQHRLHAALELRPWFRTPPPGFEPDGLGALLELWPMVVVVVIVIVIDELAEEVIEQVTGIEILSRLDILPDASVDQLMRQDGSDSRVGAPPPDCPRHDFDQPFVVPAYA